MSCSFSVRHRLHLLKGQISSKWCSSSGYIAIFSFCLLFFLNGENRCRPGSKPFVTAPYWLTVGSHCHISEGGREACAGSLVLICAELWEEMSQKRLWHSEKDISEALPVPPSQTLVMRTLSFSLIHVLSHPSACLLI